MLLSRLHSPHLRVLVICLALVSGMNIPGRVEAQSRPALPKLEWWHGLIAIGGYALLTTVDGQIQQFAIDARSTGSNHLSSVVRRMGQPEVFVPAALGLLATGLIASKPKIRDAGLRTTGGLAITGVLVTVAKYTAGRSRPSKSGSDPDDFHPFSGATSAPSGHAAMAFALATSLSDAIRHRWATALFYTAASGTAWSRVNDNVHWFSGVVGGAAIGIVTARFMDGKLDTFGLSTLRVMPSSQGLSLGWQGDF